MAEETKIERMHLGLPMWGFKDWVGSLYTRDAKPRDFLSQYARVWNAVEGNTTFYSLPDQETVERWSEETPAHFRFCFKLPREITHEKLLAEAELETGRFLGRLEPLGERLGPFMVQLPPSFGPERLAVLDRFLAALPRDFRFAVEVRHRGFFESEALGRLDEVLAERGAERVVLDTRAMRSGDQDHPDVEAARHKKPNLPVHPVALGPTPVLRFIGHPELAVDEPWLERWSEIIGSWLEDGKIPYLFAHTPVNTQAPSLARRWHELLRERAEVDLGEIPPWPGEEAVEASGQLRFDF